MIDLTALVHAVRGETSHPVRIPSPARVRVVEGCPLRCARCVAVSRRGSVELAVVKHGLATVARRSTRVLFAGGDPLTSGKLDQAVRAARRLDLGVEVLTPGVLLTERRSSELQVLGLERLRVSVDPDRPGYADSMRGAARARQAGLALDLHVALEPGRDDLPVRLFPSLSSLPIDRLVVADHGCRTPSPGVPQWSAMKATISLLEAVWSQGGEGAPVVLEGRAFHERLVLEALETVAGPEIARMVAQRLSWETAEPHLMVAR